jgi:peptidylprolyl isomerase
MNNKILVSVLVVVIVGAAIIYGLSTKGQPTPSESQTASSTDSTSTPVDINKQTNSNNTSMPPMTIDKNKSYTVTLHTDAGDIEIALNAKATPITVNNFVTLAQKNFYNGTIFHRVIKDFMIQGGDPTGTGSGGPGYQFADEPFTGDYNRGAVAMANAGPNTNGSQFFIMHKAVPLQKDYIIFGQVTKGLDVVDKIATAPVTASVTGEASKPVTPIKINSVTVTEK